MWISRLELICKRQYEIEATLLLLAAGFPVIPILRDDRVAASYVTQRNTPRLEWTIVTTISLRVVAGKQMKINRFS